MNQDIYAQLELVDGGILGEGRQVMDLQELVNIGRKASKETGDFINRYLHDHTKKWPVKRRFSAIREDNTQKQEMRTQTRTESMVG